MRSSNLKIASLLLLPLFLSFGIWSLGFTFPAHAHTASVSDSLNVNLTVKSCNENTLCETGIGETHANCPTDCDDGGGIIPPPPPPPPPTIVLKITDIIAMPDTTSAVISWKTNVSAFSEIAWGETLDYELGSIAEVVPSTSHTSLIDDLEPGTTYYFKIKATDASKPTVTASSLGNKFVTLGELEDEPPSNPLFFDALYIEEEMGIELSWANPDESDFEAVRIVRSTSFFPTTPDDGVIVYEGDGESSFDADVLGDTMYYYAIFARDLAGQYSSGLVDSEWVPGVAVEPDVEPEDELDEEPTIEDILDDLQTASSTLPNLTFLFTQTGGLPKIFRQASRIELESDKNTTVSIPYDLLPENLKTIVFVFRHPKDPSKIFSFMLRVDERKTEYTGTIGPLLDPGEYAVSAYVIDHKLGSLAKINGTIFVATVTKKVGLANLINSRTLLSTGGTVALFTTVLETVVVATRVQSFYDLYLLLARLISALFGIFGLKRKNKPWGTVYDSVTKRPIDPAFVSVREKGKSITDAITDLDGRYGFFLPSGIYTLEAGKTHYSFPSKILGNKDADELYTNLYHGEEVLTAEGEVITRNIPLDPVDFDWNEFVKQKKALFRIYSKRERIKALVFDTLFALGFLFTLFATVLSPSIFNFSLLSFYVIVFVVQTYWRVAFKATRVLDSATGEPYSFAIVRVFLSNLNQEIKRVVTDQFGRFYLLVSPGKYYLTIDAKMPDGSYRRVHRSEELDLVKGVLVGDIKVGQNPQPKAGRLGDENLKTQFGTLVIAILLGFGIWTLGFVSPAHAALSSFNKQINYQGKLTGSDGALVGDGDYNMTFRLYSASSGGTALWTESYTSTTTTITVTNGLFSVLLGQTTSLTTFDFNRDLYLGVTIGGSSTPAVWDGEMTPRRRLGTVPAAFVSDTLDGLDSIQFARSDDPTIIASSSTSTLLVLVQNGSGDVFSASSSNALLFVIGNSGNVGIGTSSPYARLSVVGETVSRNFTATSTTATSTLTNLAVTNFLNVSSTATSTAANGWNITAGCFSISGTCVGGSSFTGSGSAGLAAVWTSATALTSSSSLSTFVGGTGTSTFSTGGIIFFDGVKLTQDSTNFFWDNTNQRLGIGTSSPYARLSVVGASGVVADHYDATNTNATSTLEGGLSVGSSDFVVVSGGNKAYFNGSGITTRVGVGTSSPTDALVIAANDPQIALHGVATGDSSRAYIVLYDSAGTQKGLVGDSVTTDSDVYLQSFGGGLRFQTGGANTRMVIESASGLVGISTTSPYARLSVEMDTTNPAFVVSNQGSSTPSFIVNGVNQDGRVGVATGSPFATFSVGGQIAGDYFTGIANSTSTAANGWNITAGCFAISGTCVGGSSFTGSGSAGLAAVWTSATALTSSSSLSTFVGGTGTSTYSTGGVIFSDGVKLTQDSTNFFWDNTNQRLGIGTSSPYARLSVAGPVVADNFIATSTTATSTFAGAVGIGTSTPYLRFSVIGRSFFGVGDNSNASTSITQLSSAAISAGGAVGAMDTFGKYIYVGGTNLITYEVSRTGSTTQVSTIAPETTVTDISVKWPYLYASFGATAVNEIKVYDIHDPARPRLIGGIERGVTQNSLQTAGSYLYAVSNSVTGFDFQIIDISNPASLKVVGGLDLGALNNVEVYGNYAYIDTSTILYVVDVSDPSNPKITSQLTIGGGGSAGEMQSDGRYLFTAQGAEVKVIDLMDPVTPLVVATFPAYTPQDMKLSGGYLYIAAATGGSGGDEVHVYDVRNPRNPFRISGADGGGTPAALSLSNGYLFLSTTGGNLLTYDVGGIETQSLFAHSLSAGVFDVIGNTKVGGTISGSGFNVGGLGLYSRGSGIFSTYASGTTTTLPALSAVVADTDRASVSDVLSIYHVSTSTMGGVAGIGSGLLFGAMDSAGDATSSARIAGVMTATAAASPTSVLTFSTKNANTSLTEWMRLDNLGRLGIGTTSPYAALSVSGAGGVVADRYHATNSSATSTFEGGLLIGTTTSATSWNLTVQGGVCISAGKACPATRVSGGLRVETTGSIADDPGDIFVDIAESYPSSELMGPGEIAQIDTGASDKAVVKKAVTGSAVIGIVSTAPAIAINGADLTIGPSRIATSTRPHIALTGRVPVRVSLENGIIKKGDRVSASSVSGIGRKAKDSEQTVGIALEDWDGTDGKDKVLVFVNLTAGRLSENVSGGEIDFSAKDLRIKSIASSLGNWSISEDGVLVARKVQAQELCLGSTCIDESKLKTLLQNAGLGSEVAPAPVAPEIPDATETPATSSPEQVPEVAPSQPVVESEPTPATELAPAEVPE